jgi:hypothetical protein
MRLLRIARPVLIVLLVHSPLHGWGVKGHEYINRVALHLLPDDGPLLLRTYEDWIVFRASAPDTWRYASEPFLKIDEDPNHGWFRERFLFMDEIPRSRYEFVLRLYDEHLRTQSADFDTAKMTNIRWTGSLPYAIVECYERMKSSFRIYRQLKADSRNTKNIELDLAFYMGWLGHYAGDASMPLHVTMHDAGWRGPNPEGYTTDPTIHRRMETVFVDMIEFSDADVAAFVGATVLLEDPFDSVLEFLDRSRVYVEAVYRMEREGVWEDRTSSKGRDLVLRRLAAGARLLRDLTHTAWIESGKPLELRRPSPSENPVHPDNPNYNPATGSAPAPRRVPGPQ